jgi:hypothetical protein
VILWIVVYRIVPFSGWALVKKGLFRPGAALCLLAVVAYELRNCTVRNYGAIALTLALLAIYCVYAWRGVLDGEDRTFAADFYKSKKRSLREKIFGATVALEGM